MCVNRLLWRTEQNEGTVDLQPVQISVPVDICRDPAGDEVEASRKRFERFRIVGRVVVFST
jgi:hypothetical protein